MRVVIVDDEPLARRGIRLRLNATRDTDVVAECKNGGEAVKSIQHLAPDLVFLDIHLPDLDGFEVLRRLPTDKLPLVIFLTAYDQHALAAFNAQALDYLLKPIDAGHFARALERARLLSASRNLSEIRDRLSSLLGSKEATPHPTYRTHLLVKTGRRTTVVCLSEIDWITSDGDYVTLHVKDKTYLVRQTMNSLDRELDPDTFLRIHRSTIIRVSQISELTTLDDGGFLVRLRNGTELKSSRSYTQRLAEWL